MKSFILAIIVAASFAATLPAGTAQAKTTSQKPSMHNNGRVNYDHGRRSFDRFYRGWGSYCYLSGYGCYGFFDPACGEWFYWYQPTARYLPVRVIATFRPVASGVAMLPPGAVPVTTGAVPVTVPTTTEVPPMPEDE